MGFPGRDPGHARAGDAVVVAATDTIRIDPAGWLVQDHGPQDLIRLAPTPRRFTLDRDEPLGLVWHTTDLAPSVDGAKLADRIRYYRHGRHGVDRAASWHMLIDRLGKIHVAASVLDGTWHCGVPGTIGGQRVSSINRNSIGIELHNAGRLVERSGRFYQAGELPGPSAEVPGASVQQVDGKFYEVFSQPQVDAAERLVRAMSERFQTLGRKEFSYGHVDFDPERKSDPWPLWRTVVLPALLDRVFGAVP